VAAAAHPLQSLFIDGDFDSCVELVSEAIAHGGHVSLGFSFAQRVGAPLPRSARTAPSAGATKELAAESDSDTDSFAEELAAGAAADDDDGLDALLSGTAPPSRPLSARAHTCKRLCWRAPPLRTPSRGAVAATES
jgi:hypothetical protein